MGSQPSVIEVPEGHKIKVIQRGGSNSTAPSSSRSKGFQEVEIKDTSTSNTPRQNQKRKKKKSQENWEKVQDKVDALTEGTDTDFHSVVKKSHKKAKESNEFDQPQYKAEDDLVLETFYHASGNVISCIYQAGQRYYMDWQTQDWVAFPKKWYKEGVLVTENVIQNEQDSAGAGTSGTGSGGAATGTGSGSNQNDPSYAQMTGDDREGFIEHPTKGRIPTYIYEEKRNIHYFYDENTGSWVRLPISWELRSELVQKLIAPIKEALPDWKDDQDMLAALRVANYDPHDTISTYLSVGEKGHIQVPRGADDAKLLQEKDAIIQDAKEKLEKLENQIDRGKKYLDEERSLRRSAESMVGELKERVSELEAELSTITAQMESMRPKSRAKTAKQQDVDTDKEKVNRKTIIALKEIAKMLHKEHVRLKMEADQRAKELHGIIKQCQVGIMRVKLADSGTSKELDEMKSLYRKEALERKLLYNKLQELRGNIRVFCRCRYDDRTECCLEFPSDREVLLPTGKKSKFDHVFTPQSKQIEVFNEAKAIITSCVDGYSVCILAYGQTGSGKTFTMMGTPADPGVNIRAIQELLKVCAERENVDFTLKASMLEIYNENVQDLLSSEAKTLELRTQGNKIHLPGLTEMFVENQEDIQNIMQLGDKNRTTASTKMNSTSSRSHLLFMITVEGTDRASGATSTGTLTLCDLAGSERVGKTEATGQRLVEAAAINKSLTALGQVFTALRTGQLHIPYRNSKLTHILQPSLGGDAKACLFVMVSPDETNVTETNSTLVFGSNARQVALGEAKKNVRK